MAGANDPQDLASLNRASLLELTVVGRKTGTPRTVKIWFVATPDKIYVSSGRGSNSQWVKNLKQTPSVTCRIGATRFQGVAVWLEERRVRETVFPLFFRKYFRARLFRWIGWYQEAFAFEISPQQARG
jgi:deazaflavin-dependent oxidoreductase (nitroreductase family)